MSEATDNRPTVLFWAVSAVLLLWGVWVVLIYATYFVMSPQEFSEAAESAANTQRYADYVANIPAWAIATGVISAIARLLGAIGLLVRRVWALPLYVISAVLLAITLFRGFVLSNAASVMSAPHIAIEILFVTLSIFAVWFTHKMKSKRVLQ
jgi:hypothetical protein